MRIPSENFLPKNFTIPTEIMLDDRLSRLDISVLGYIQFLKENKWPIKNAILASRLGASRSGIDRSISNLRKTGYLDCKYNTETNQRIRIATSTSHVKVDVGYFSGPIKATSKLTWGRSEGDEEQGEEPHVKVDPASKLTWGSETGECSSNQCLEGVDNSENPQNPAGDIYIKYSNITSIYKNQESPTEKLSKNEGGCAKMIRTKFPKKKEPRQDMAQSAQRPVAIPANILELSDKSIDIMLIAENLSKRLADAISENKNCFRTPGVEWNKQMILLLKKDLYDKSAHNPLIGAIKRASLVLKWYAEHMNDPYVPIAESAKAFREKFLRIEAAIARSEDKRKCAYGYSKQGSRSQGVKTGTNYQQGIKLSDFKAGRASL